MSLPWTYMVNTTIDLVDKNCWQNIFYENKLFAELPIISFDTGCVFLNWDWRFYIGVGVNVVRCLQAKLNSPIEICLVCHAMGSKKPIIAGTIFVGKIISYLFRTCISIGTGWLTYCIFSACHSSLYFAPLVSMKLAIFFVLEFLSNGYRTSPMWLQENVKIKPSSIYEVDVNTEKLEFLYFLSATQILYIS